MDAVVAHQAATAAEVCRRASRSGAGAPRSAQAVQLAALKALLASVLAPCAHRPPFFAHALHLFRSVRAPLVDHQSSPLLPCCYLQGSHI